MKTVQIKKTNYEPPEFHGACGHVLRETGHGYLVIATDDGREVILHPDSVTEVQ